jgi:hypothetical protein
VGRKGKYETHVQPHLADIKAWYETMTEAQIASKLGVSSSSWENYKRDYKELRECLKRSQEALAEELKSTLKKKALGFYYDEVKVKEEPNEYGEMEVVERITTRRYAVPDLGSIHLLLKNLDDHWHNDDVPTMKLKKQQMELAQEKAEASDW